MLAGQLIIIWASSKVTFFPGMERFLSIVGTWAEIIAGLYGLTLAGYTFFLSRMDALSASDATLDYVVDSIKNRFKYLIWYITSNVLMTLLISLSLMYVPSYAEEKLGFFYRLFCNEFLLFMVFSVALILWYSVQVVNPNCVEKEAKKLKQRIEGYSTVPGNAVDFISCYGEIIEACEAMIPDAVLRQLHKNEGHYFERTLHILDEQKMIPKILLADIRIIHRYYACLINSGSMEVSRDMCQMAKRVQEQLTRKFSLLLGKMQ